MVGAVVAFAWFGLVSQAASPPRNHCPLSLTPCGTSTQFQHWSYDGNKGNGDGFFRLEGTPRCMDGAEPFGGEGSVVQVYDCHAVDPAEPNQSWNWAGNGTSIASRVSGSRCLRRALDGSSGVKLSSNCSESWELNSIGQLLHAPSGLCLGALASNEPIPSLYEKSLFSKKGKDSIYHFLLAH